MSLDVVFMGTPDFAVPVLRSIIEAGHRVVAVYTQPPRPAGRRGLAETPSPVHREAEAHGIPVRTPVSFKTPEAVTEFKALSADVAVVVAYGMLLPKPVLEAPRLGCINLHASLLPRWRGAAPIHRAIMAGDDESGVMTMQMDEGLDTGPVLLTSRTPIGDDETMGELHDRLAEIGAGLVAETLLKLEDGSLVPVAQHPEGVTYARKIDKAEALIDFTLPAASVHNQIRGLSPFPGAWFEAKLPGGAERVKVLKAEQAPGSGRPGELLDEDRLTVACGSGAVRLLNVQRAGRKPVSDEEFLRGAGLRQGAIIA